MCTKFQESGGHNNQKLFSYFIQSDMADLSVRLSLIYETIGDWREIHNESRICIAKLL